MIYDCIVIGGGAAGLFFAADLKGLAEDGFRGLILEKTSRLGTKLLMSGGGHCNITHAGNIKDFLPCYGSAYSREERRIRKLLYKHSNLSLIDFLEKNGIPTIAEEDGRVFPKSKNASDILNLLLRKAEKNGFDIAKNVEVVKITPVATGCKGSFFELSTRNNRNEEEIYSAATIVISTGGLSYPATGSDGSMFRVLERDLGLHTTELKPALCPITPEDYRFEDLAGLSLEAEIKTARTQAPEIKGGVRHKTCGALLFTHSEFSGPAAINISGNLAKGDILSINYIPPYTYEDAFSSLQKALDKSKADLSNVINSTFDIPRNLARKIATDSQGSTKKAARLLTEDTYTVKNSGDFGNAMVTKGGIALDQIDLNTMEIKDCEGAYVIGEALDVDGLTGGYNLQFAYSTACAASEKISEKFIPQT